MYFRKFVIAVMAGALSLSALAQEGPARAGAIGPTISEVAQTKLELEQAKDAAELSKLKGEKVPAALPQLAPGASSAGIPPAPVVEDPVLVAMYGVGAELRCEVAYKGALLRVSKASDRIGPWRVATISPGMLEIVRGKERKTLYVVGRAGAPAATDALPGLPNAASVMR